MHNPSYEEVPVPEVEENDFAAPPALNPAGPVAALPVLPVAGRFCRTCGAVWQPEWAECPGCAARAPEAPHETHAVWRTQKTSVQAALGLYFTLLAASAVGFGAAFAGAEGLWVLVILSIAHSLIIAAWSAVWWRDLLSALYRRVHTGWFAAALGLSLTTFTLATVLTNLVHHFGHVPVIEFTPVFFRAGYGWGMVILFACVQPAVFEELAFRGVIYSSLGRVLTAWEAIPVSALLFMTLHLTVASFPHLFVMGLVLGYLRHRTGSLLPGVLLHFSHNLLCVVSEVALGPTPW